MEKILIIIFKNSFLDIWQGSEYADNKIPR